MGVIDLVTGSTEELYRLLAKHGLSLFAAVQFARGMLLLILIPDEAVTPLFVLMAADHGLHVAMIAIIAATGILAGNFLIYAFIRGVKMRYLGTENSIEDYSRVLRWALEKHAAGSMVVLRMVPGFGDWMMIPAALARMPVKTFLKYSFIGLLLYEALIGFATFYGIKQGLFFQTEIGYQAYLTVNQTATGQEIITTLQEMDTLSPPKKPP
jgi:membrane protein DedA with SNARE-associated domain